jgi:hypothetical protein
VGNGDCVVFVECESAETSFLRNELPRTWCGLDNTDRGLALQFCCLINQLEGAAETEVRLPCFGFGNNSSRTLLRETDTMHEVLPARIGT